MSNPKIITSWFTRKQGIPYVEFDKFNLTLQTSYTKRGEITVHRGSLDKLAAEALMKYYLPGWWYAYAQMQEEGAPMPGQPLSRTGTTSVLNLPAGPVVPTLTLPAGNHADKIFSNIEKSLTLKRMKKGDRPGSRYRLWYSSSADFLNIYKPKNKLFRIEGNTYANPDSESAQNGILYWNRSKGHGPLLKSIRISLESVDHNMQLVKKLFEKYAEQYKYFSGQIKPGINFIQEYKYLSAAIGSLSKLLIPNQLEARRSSGIGITVNFDPAYNITRVYAEKPAQEGSDLRELTVGLLSALESSPLNIPQTRSYLARWPNIVHIAKNINRERSKYDQFTSFIDEIFPPGAPYRINYSGPSHSETAAQEGESDTSAAAAGTKTSNSNPMRRKKRMALTDEEQTANQKKLNSPAYRQKVIQGQTKKWDQSQLNVAMEVKNAIGELQDSEPVKLITTIINRFGLDALIKEAIACIMFGGPSASPDTNIRLSGLVGSLGNIFSAPKKPLPIVIPKFPSEKELLTGLFSITGDIQKQIEQIFKKALFEGIKSIIEALVQLIHEQCDVKNAAMGATQGGDYGAVNMADLLIDINLPGALDLLGKGGGTNTCFSDFNISPTSGKNFLSQVSQILTPIEICQFLTRSASRDTIEAVMEFIGTSASASIQGTLNNELTAITFFGCVGDISDIKDLCQSIIDNDIIPNVGEICIREDQLLNAIDDHNIRELLGMLENGINLAIPHINLNCPENTNYIPNPLAERSVPQLMSVLIESIAPSFYYAADGTKTVLLKPQIGVNETANAVMASALSSSAAFEQSTPRTDSPQQVAGGIIEVIVEQMQQMISNPDFNEACETTLEEVITGPGDIAKAAQMISDAFRNFNFSGVANLTSQLGNNRDAIAQGTAATTIYTFPTAFKDDFYEFIPTTIDKNYQASDFDYTIWNFDVALTTPSFSKDDEAWSVGSTKTAATTTDITKFTTEIPLPPTDNIQELIAGWDRRDHIQEAIDTYNAGDQPGERPDIKCSDYSYEAWLQSPAFEKYEGEGWTQQLTVLQFARTWAGQWENHDAPQSALEGDHSLGVNNNSAFFQGRTEHEVALAGVSNRHAQMPLVLFPLRWHDPDAFQGTAGSAGTLEQYTQQAQSDIDAAVDSRSRVHSANLIGQDIASREVTKARSEGDKETVVVGGAQFDQYILTTWGETGWEVMTDFEIAMDPYMQYLYSQSEYAKIYQTITAYAIFGRQNTSKIAYEEEGFLSAEQEQEMADQLFTGEEGSAALTALYDWENKDFAPVWYRYPLPTNLTTSEAWIGTGTEYRSTEASRWIDAGPNGVSQLLGSFNYYGYLESEGLAGSQLQDKDPYKDVGQITLGGGLMYGYPSRCLVEIFDIRKPSGQPAPPDYIRENLNELIHEEIEIKSEGFIWKYEGGALKYALEANEEWLATQGEEPLPVHIGVARTADGDYMQTPEGVMKFIFRKTFNKTLTETMSYPTFERVTEAGAPIVRVEAPDAASMYDVALLQNQMDIGTLAPDSLLMYEASDYDLYGLDVDAIMRRDSNPAKGIFANLVITSIKKMLDRNDIDLSNTGQARLRNLYDALEHQYHSTAMASLIKQLSFNVLEKGSFSTEKVLKLLMVSDKPDLANQQIGDLLDYQTIIDEVKAEFIEASCQDTDLSEEQILRNSLRYGVILLFLQTHLVQFYLQNLFVFSAFKLEEVFTLEAVVSYISRSVSNSMDKMLGMVSVPQFPDLFRTYVANYMKRKLNRSTALDSEVLNTINLTPADLKGPNAYENVLKYLQAKRLKDSAPAVQNIISRCAPANTANIDSFFIRNAIGGSKPFLQDPKTYIFDYGLARANKGIVPRPGKLKLGLASSDAELLSYGGFRFEKIIRWSASESLDGAGDPVVVDIELDDLMPRQHFAGNSGGAPTAPSPDSHEGMKSRFFVPAGESLINGFASAEKLRRVADHAGYQAVAQAENLQCRLHNPKLYYRLVYYIPMQSDSDDTQVVGERSFSSDIEMGEAAPSGATEFLKEDNEILVSNKQAKNQEAMRLFQEIFTSEDIGALETVFNKEEAYVPIYVGPARTRGNMIVGIPIGEIPSSYNMGGGTNSIDIFSTAGRTELTRVGNVDVFASESAPIQLRNASAARVSNDPAINDIKTSDLYDLVFGKSIDKSLILTTLLFNNFYLTNTYFSKMGSVFEDTKNAIAELLITLAAPYNSPRPIRTQRAMQSIQDSVMNAGAKNIDRPNIGMYIVKAIIETPLDILKGLAEIIDPHVAITKVIRDVTGVAIQQFVGHVQAKLDEDPIIASLGIDVEKLLEEVIFCQMNAELANIAAPTNADPGQTLEGVSSDGLGTFPTFSTKGVNFTGTIPGLFMAPPGPLGIFYLIYGLIQRDIGGRLEDAADTSNATIADSAASEKANICGD